MQQELWLRTLARVWISLVAVIVNEQLGQPRQEPNQVQAAPMKPLANILLGPLMRLAVPLRRIAARGGRLVLSGLLPDHANAALAIYRAQGFALERRIRLEGWVTLVLKR